MEPRRRHSPEPVGQSFSRAAQNNASKKADRSRRWLRIYRGRSAIVALLLLMMIIVVIRTSYSSIRSKQRMTDTRLVEFYIHGNGNGHWTGSIAVMERLIEKGFQLRIYAGRHMPSFSTSEDPKVLLQILNGQEVPPAVPEKPVPVNYTLVTPLMPTMSLAETLSTLWSRIQRDPSLSRPLMIISDGDLPGLVQARLHGIPSIHVTHGETFASLPAPSWMTDAKQQAAWRRQQLKNKRFNHNLAHYTVATNHVPMEGSALTRLRSFVRHLAHRRASILQNYNNYLSKVTQQSASNSQRNRMVVTYFRDGNGQKVVEALAAEGLDVLAFGAIDSNVRVQGPGRIVHVKDSSYFAQLVSIADGVVGSGGCQLIAECIYSQIPILVFYKETDDEHWLNALMAERLRYRDGRRIAYGASFGTLEDGLIPSEVKLFAAHVKQSNASRSFYEHHLDLDVNVEQAVLMSNELVEGHKDSADLILDIVERVQSDEVVLHKV